MEFKKQTFDPDAFVRLKECEANHFWFDVRRKWILDKISKYVPPPAGFIEIGCGTGNVSSFLSQKGYSVTGCDIFKEAIDLAWPNFTIIKGSADNLPFEDNMFDVAGIFDVIEHFDNDIDVIKESVRVTKKGGLIALTVPAREDLWSYVDEISYHKRRYTKEGLRLLFEKCGIKTILVEYIFMSLYLPMKIMRSFKTGNNEILHINPVLNLFAKIIFNTERILSRKVPLPIGTSIIAIGTKV